MCDWEGGIIDKRKRIYFPAEMTYHYLIGIKVKLMSITPTESSLGKI